jgi:hypothetical protein
MRPADRTIRLVAGLIVAAGLAAAGLAILAEELGVGAGAAQGVFTWKRAVLLIAGALIAAGGLLLLVRPRLASRLIDWEEMGSLELDVRIVATVILAAGIAAVGIAILAEELAVGAGAAQGVFTWKRVALLIAGGIAMAVGALLLARPRIASSLVRSPRIAAASARGATRRWLVAAGVIGLVGVFGALAFVWLTDRLETDPVWVEAAPTELTPLEQWRVDAEHICKIQHAFELRGIARGGYTSRDSEAFHNPSRLGALAAATSKLQVDLRRLGPPSEDVAAYRRLLVGLGAVAAAYRTAAPGTSDSGEEARERARLAHARAADAERGITNAAMALAIPSCGTGPRTLTMVDGTCERHDARGPRVDRIAAASDRQRLLRVNASALSALRRDLRRVLWRDLPQADQPLPRDGRYSELLGSMKRLAAALRATAVAIDNADEARERSEMNRVFAAAEEGGAAAGELQVPKCGV